MTFVLHGKLFCSSLSYIWGVVSYDVLGRPVPVALPFAAHMHMALLVGCLQLFFSEESVFLPSPAS